jgi:2-amino-4-hydroxy-6-hydroxymethyldihydropteridine diphosphokinase
MLRESAIYESEPRDLPNQPWFLNQVVELETSLFPRQLLAMLQDIERAMGRRRTIAKGPRIIDLDILLLGDVVMTTPELEIPHPRLTERRFVLEPLGELAPELRLPGDSKERRTIKQWLAEVGNQPVRRL